MYRNEVIKWKPESSGAIVIGGLQGQLLSGLHSNSYVSIGEEKELKEPTRAMGQRCIGMGESIV